jgi:hypothetical protein
MRLQAAEGVRGILRGSCCDEPPAAHLQTGDSEVSEEKLVSSRPLLKALVKLVELVSEGFKQILIVARWRRLSEIREDCDRSLSLLDEIRISAEVNAEVPYLDRALVCREVAVHSREVNTCADGICDKPLQTSRWIAEVAVFFQVGVAGMSQSERHAGPLFMQRRQGISLLMGSAELKDYLQVRG